MKAWSGDHCVDPKLVPGVLFCNRRIKDPNPRLMDIAATALEMFGVDVPKVMDGRPLVVADADGVFPGERRTVRSSRTRPKAPAKEAEVRAS
jgi:hypothetical protein